MNTEEKFVHPDIQDLKTETSPNTLRARILNNLEKTEEKKSMSIRKNVARLSFSAIAVATIVTATLMMSNTASAVERVHAALQDASRYHITSYMISQGKRTKTTETWVNGEERKVTIFGPDGKAIDLSHETFELKLDLKDKIDVLPAKVAADGEVLLELVFDKVEKTEVKKSAPSKAGVASEVFIADGNGIWQSADGGVVILDESISFKQGEQGIWVAAPNMICGQNGVEYLRKLLSDKSLWNIQKGVVINNRRLDKYSLKEGLAHIELFVDPAFELPIVSRTRFGTGKDEMTIEDVYDYVTPMPEPVGAVVSRPATSQKEEYRVEGRPLK